MPARLGTDSAGDSSTEFHTHDELSEPRFGDWLMAKQADRLPMCSGGPPHSQVLLIGYDCTGLMILMFDGNKNRYRRDGHAIGHICT